MAAKPKLDPIWLKKNCPPSLQKGAMLHCMSDFSKQHRNLEKSNSMDIARFFKAVGTLKAAIAKDQQVARKAKDNAAVKFLADMEKAVHAETKSKASHLTPKSSFSFAFVPASAVKPKDQGAPPDDDAIANQGNNRWQLISGNKAVSAAKSMSCQAIPKRVSPRDLQKWQAEKTGWVCALKNESNTPAVSLKFEMQYLWFGQRSSTSGVYLSDCKLWVAESRVIWGYSVDADVAVRRLWNAGSKTSPVGALALQVSVNVASPLDCIAKSWTITCQGDRKREAK